jgi:cephalosporin hydroxylase
MKTLQEILKEYNLNITTNPRYGTDKGTPKTFVDGFYQEKFEPLRNKKITLVEIGVRSGASLKLWKEFFSKRATIIGIDNFKFLQELGGTKEEKLYVEDWLSDGVQFVDSDAYTQEMVDKIDGGIDILIDDGPHTPESHQKLLELYLPKMNKGGYVIIEDVSYNPDIIFPHVPEEFQDDAYVCDFGGYDDRLIIIST